MAVARRAVGTVVSGSGSSIAVNLATNAVGDVMLMFVNAGSGSISSTPSGWTLLTSVTVGSGSRLYVYWRYISSVISGTTTVSLSSSQTYRAATVSYSGASSTQPPAGNIGTFGFNNSAGFPDTTVGTNGSASMFLVWGVSASGSVTLSNESISVGSWAYSEAVDSGGTRSLAIVDGRTTSSSASAHVSGSYSSSASAYNSAVVILDVAAAVSPPVVDAGPDATVNAYDTFVRTATETNSPTTRAWTIVSGPADSGTTIGTVATLSWTPDVTGVYTLRYTATNSGGSDTDDVLITVVSTGGSIKWYNGSGFVAKPVKYWTGSVWTVASVKVWNGSAWVVTDY